MVYTGIMKLIVGLGNPGEHYAGTRHNLGFWCVDQFAGANDVEFTRKTKFKASVTELKVLGESVIIAKPNTYYNLSGEAVRALAGFYSVPPEDILIIHDELALTVGQVRARRGGSDAGNNGIKSINAHIGQNTARIRIGARGETYDPSRAVEYVLGTFNAHDAKRIESLKPVIFHLIEDFIRGDFNPVTHSA